MTRTSKAKKSSKIVSRARRSDSEQSDSDRLSSESGVERKQNLQPLDDPHPEEAAPGGRPDFIAEAALSAAACDALRAARPRPRDVAELLRWDKNGRADPREAGLIPLEALQARTWDFSLPTLVRPVPISWLEAGIRPKSEIIRRLHEMHPMVQHMDLTNLFIAGGCVASLVSSADPEPEEDSRDRDVDVFVYGLSVDEANARVLRIISDLAVGHFAAVMRKFRTDAQLAFSRAPRFSVQKFDIATARVARSLLDAADSPNSPNLQIQDGEVLLVCPPHVNGGSWANLPCEMRAARLGKFTAVRTAGSLTFKFRCDGAPDTTVQVILRLYDSPSQILHGFDIGAAAVGFDGANVWFTELARHAHENRAIIVDTTRRSGPYEKRIRKYFARGFEVILPRLDLSRLGLTPALKYNRPEIVDLPRMPFTYSRREGNAIYFGEWLRRPESELASGSSAEYGPSAAMLHDASRAVPANIRALVTNVPNLVHAVSGNIITAEIARVLTVQPNVQLPDIHAHYNELRHERPDRLLGIKQIRTHLPTASVEALVAAVDGGTAHVALRAAIDHQLEVVTAAWKARVCDADHTALGWITENPGAQLTSSFEPIWEPPEAWYGDYMRADE